PVQPGRSTALQLNPNGPCGQSECRVHHYPRRGRFFSTLLVSCFRSSQTKAGDVGEDLVGCLDPHKGRRSLVVERQVEPDGVLQGSPAAVSSASQLLLGEQGEPTLDLVDPRGVGGREVKLEAGVAEQPA